MIEINQQQVAAMMRLTLTAGGPIAALIISRSGMSEKDYIFYVELGLAFIPGAIVSVWSWARNRRATQIKIVETIPEVATVVIKDEANGKIAAMAQSEGHPNIVTETQNEIDAKKGTKA